MKTLVQAILGVAFIVGLAFLSGADASAQDKAKAKSPDEGKKGTVSGIVVAKAENVIEVKGDGEENARKYVPQWVGGLPKNGGGPDKAMLQKIKDVKVGSRVELEWVYHERPRVVGLKVLREPKDK